MSLSKRVGLALLKKELVRRGKAIQRATNLTKISFGEPGDQHFSMHVWWKGGEFIHLIKWEDYFKETDGKTQMTKVCRIVQQLMSIILKERGI